MKITIILHRLCIASVETERVISAFLRTWALKKATCFPPTSPVVVVTTRFPRLLCTVIVDDTPLFVGVSIFTRPFVAVTMVVSPAVLF